LDMVMNSNPQLSQAIAPEQREMMRSMLGNPQFMANMLPMLAAMESMGNPGAAGMGGLFNGVQGLQQQQGQQQQQPGQREATPSGMPPLPMPFMNPALLSMLNPALAGMGSPASATPNSNTAPQAPPEERFQTQLSQLQEMGFFDGKLRVFFQTKMNFV
jgi:ubiquilin